MNTSRRSQVYRVLAQAFCPPTPELARWVVDGSLHHALTDALGEAEGSLEALHQPGTPAVIEERLSKEHYRLFRHPRHRLELAESVYKPWSAADTSGMPFARERGLLMGEPARHLLELYRLTGWTPPVEFASRPDYLALELAFMAYLVEYLGPVDQAQFLDDHLDWLPDLLQAAAEWDPAPFYATVLAATRVWIEQESIMSRKELATLQRC